MMIGMNSIRVMQVERSAAVLISPIRLYGSAT